MQKGILLQDLDILQNSNLKPGTVNNAIIQLGDIDDSGKGRKFVSKFIQPGLVKIEGHGIVLLKKETLDESLPTIVGSPVIIQHRDVTEENADELRCGVIANAYFNQPDGWYYVDGIIWDDKAQELINKGWSVSCSYDYLAFNDEGGEENNIHYDKEFTQLNFTHLAIVDNPRYERANIVFNSKVNNFSEENIDREPKGTPKGGQFKAFHGSNIDFNKFDENIDWHFFSSNYTIGKSYTIPKQGIVYETELNLKNPYYFDAKGNSWADLDKQGLRTNDIARKAKAEGYDSVIIKDLKDIGRHFGRHKWSKDELDILDTPHTDYIVFNPQNINIKSKNIINTGDIMDINNAKDWDNNDGEWITINGNHLFIKKGQSKDEVVKSFIEKQGDKKHNIKEKSKENKDNNIEKFNKEYKTIEGMIKRRNLEPRKEEKLLEQLNDYKQKFDKNLEPHQEEALLEDLNDFKMNIYKNIDTEADISLSKSDKIGMDVALTLMASESEKRGSKGTVTESNRLKDKIKKGEKLNNKELSSVQIALRSTSSKEANKLADKLEKLKKINNAKEQDMAIIDELKKLIFKVENNKENETMVENEKVDKRKLIDEVAGIMKSAGCDDEDIRTAIGKMEKIGYDDSEASADNKKVKNEADEEDKKVDNEEDEKEEDKKVDNEDDKDEDKVDNESDEDKEKTEDLKEDEKKDVENKCKNSVGNAKGEEFFDKINKIYNSVKKIKEPSVEYESKQARLEAGKEYFG